VTTAPYGSWASPLSPAQAAAAGSRFGGVWVAGDDVFWIESNPADGGRATIRVVRGGGAPGPLSAQVPVSARSRVNEYGGGSAWIHAPSEGDTEVYWTAAESQRIQTLRRGLPRDLTPLPPELRAWRYAAGVVTPDGAWIVCERELHVDEDGGELGEPVNDVVAVPTSGGRPQRLVGPGLAGGGDFVVGPALSPDGSVLAWLRWDHPDMPWDAAELWAGRLVVHGDLALVEEPRRVAGGRDGGAAHGLGRAVSVCLPEWSPDGRLWWCDDASDWWHLRSAGPGLPAPGAGDRAPLLVADATEEVGEPRWVSGGRRYGFTADGRVVFAAVSGGLDSLWCFDPTTSQRTRLPGPAFVSVESLAVDGDTVAVIAGLADRPTSVWRVDLRAGTATDLREPEPPLQPDWISVATPMTFPTAGGSEAHALFYPPRSGDHEGPAGESPPLVVRIHGGPTASARPEFSPSVQFWTTRGFAVVDVNYRGSTGYGRRYRDLLQGQWGLSDVEDCLAAAQHLGSQGQVDGSRCVIRGGSAGGFTTLAALCFQAEWDAPGTFSAGCSLYGVTDLAALAADTHKFESRYLDGLVGPLPQDAAVYEARSPLSHAEQFDRPVLLLQGADDRIVPPSQAEVLVRALTERGIPHAYVLFQGEGHGFLREASVINALETELAFYGQVLGFAPAGDLPVLNLASPG